MSRHEPDHRMPPEPHPAVGILARVAEGDTNREIGAALQLSEKTVRNYVSIILGKLGLNSRVRLDASFPAWLERAKLWNGKSHRGKIPLGSFAVMVDDTKNRPLRACRSVRGQS